MVKELERGSARVILLRHGECSWNGKMVGRRSNPPLSSLGKEQAINAGEALKEYGDIAYVLSSTRQRAIDTVSLATGRTPDKTQLLDEGKFGTLEEAPVTMDIIKNLQNPINRDHEWVRSHGFEFDESILRREKLLIEENWNAMQDVTTLWGGHARWMAPVLRPSFHKKGEAIKKIDNVAIAVFDVRRTSDGWEKTLQAHSGIPTVPLAA